MQCPMCNSQSVSPIKTKIFIVGDDKITTSERKWKCDDCNCIFSAMAAYHNYPIRRFNKNGAR